jgi:hypothetical protein
VTVTCLFVSVHACENTHHHGHLIRPSNVENVELLVRAVLVRSPTRDKACLLVTARTSTDSSPLSPPVSPSRRRTHVLVFPSLSCRPCPSHLHPHPPSSTTSTHSPVSSATLSCPFHERICMSTRPETTQRTTSHHAKHRILVTHSSGTGLSTSTSVSEAQTNTDEEEEGRTPTRHLLTTHRARHNHMKPSSVSAIRWGKGTARVALVPPISSRVCLSCPAGIHKHSERERSACMCERVRKE